MTHNIFYASREQLKRALDVKETAYSNADVDSALNAASRSVESLTGRKFYSSYATRYFDWPDTRGSRPYRLWLDEDELISISTLVAGGTTIASSDYFLEPINSGPPYNRVEIDLDSSAVFKAGSTHQRAIAITGLFGVDDEHATIGTITEPITTTTATSMIVSDSSLMGVGDVISPNYGGTLDYEHMVVTEKTMTDTLVDIDAGDSLTASYSDNTLTCSTATAVPLVGETILIDSERMLVVDRASTVLTLKRAYDGSTLAAHSAGASIYAPRTLTILRGQVGSTAATHLDNATLHRQVFPGPVTELTLAYGMNNLLNRSSGYARVAGSGDSQREFTGRSIASLEKDIIRSYGRQLRLGAV